MTFNDDHIDVQAHQVRRQRGEPVDLAFSKSIIESDVLSLDITVLAKPVAKRFSYARRGSYTQGQKPNFVDFR